MAKRARGSSASVDPFDRRYIAEFIGTAILILIGCGTIAIAGASAGAPAGALTVGLAFGIALMALIYSIGAISGGHFNPAVSVGMWAAGRMKPDDLPGYIIWQVLGGIAGAGLIALILWLKTPTLSLATANLGQNAIPTGFGYPLTGAFVVEFLATFVFVVVILAATAGRGGGVLAGLIIGLTYTALHLAFMSVTGLSVNPARSLGPAAWIWSSALWTGIWVFVVAPIAAGWVAGWLHREKVF